MTQHRQNGGNPSCGNARETKTKDLSPGKVLTQPSDPWHTYRTKGDVLANTKGELVSCHLQPSLEVERQACNSQRWKARSCCKLSLRDCMSDQRVSRPPVANHVFLGFLTVHMYWECHRLRPVPLRRCTAHLGLCPFSIPGSLRGLDLEVHAALCYGHPRVVHELQTLPTHASDICLQFLSLSTAQLSK